MRRRRGPGNPRPGARRNLAITFFALNYENPPSPTFDWTPLWRHQITVGVVMDFIYDALDLQAHRPRVRHRHLPRHRQDDPGRAFPLRLLHRDEPLPARVEFRWPPASGDVRHHHTPRSPRTGCGKMIFRIHSVEAIASTRRRPDQPPRHAHPRARFHQSPGQANRHRLQRQRRARSAPVGGIALDHDHLGSARQQGLRVRGLHPRHPRPVRVLPRFALGPVRFPSFTLSRDDETARG
jgi:hypothetical protein